eukprot:symbB.v1.2.008640.t1/scaffold540.1/size189765/5
MGRQTSSKGQGATRVAVLVAGCLLLAAVGDAFVSVSPSHQVTTPKPTWEVTAQPAHRNGGLATPNTQVSLFKAAASVALLCLAAGRRMGPKSKATKASIRYAVVGMTTSTTNPCTQNTPPKAPQMEDLLQFDQVEAEVATPISPISMETVTVVTSDAVDSETTVPSFCGKCAARFVAGARRSQSHRTAGPSRGRAARRAVGQRLCETVAVHTTSQTFDASKTRTKIQLGLRVSSCMRSESGRESKVSSGVEGSEMGTCLNFVAHDLKVYMLDHESALNDAIYSPLGGTLARSAIL